MQKSKISQRLLLFIALIVVGSSCAKNPVTGKRQLMLMSTSQEVAMGQEYDPQIVATFGEYDNPEMLTFIQEKGKEMGQISHRPDLEYHFRILDSPVINAFAAPGGYIYFTRGILAQFSSEAELIGVLGHEMGHVTARHMVSRQSKQQLGQILLIGGMIASEEFARYGQFAMAGMELLFLKFSRDDERESDRLGVEYSTKLGYDATHMANFFQVLEKMSMESEQGGIPTFMSTHPNPGDRYTDVLEDTKRWQDSLGISNYQVNTNSYLSMIDGMVFGEDPRQGYVEGGMFYHPELRFQFPVPSQWEVENTPMQVRMGPPDRKALIVFNIVPHDNLDEAAQQTISQLQLNVLESTRTTVNQMPAIAVLSNQSSEQQTIRALSYFIDDNGTYYAFHGIAEEAGFNNFAPQFENTMTKFRKLTDGSKINVEPKRLSIVKAPRTATLESILKNNNVPSDMLEELAFLNNMELTQQVQAGSMIKIVR